MFVLLWFFAIEHHIPLSVTTVLVRVCFVSRQEFMCFDTLLSSYCTTEEKLNNKHAKCVDGEKRRENGYKANNELITGLFIRLDFHVIVQSRTHFNGRRENCKQRLARPQTKSQSIRSLCTSNKDIQMHKCVHKILIKFMWNLKHWPKKQTELIKLQNWRKDFKKTPSTIWSLLAEQLNENKKIGHLVRYYDCFDNSQWCYAFIVRIKN